MRRGDLVVNAIGEYGILRDEERNHYIILMGDGLNLRTTKDRWKTVQFGTHGIPSNFIELLPAFEYIPVKMGGSVAEPDSIIWG
jgi:hypothetical protein